MTQQYANTRILIIDDMKDARMILRRMMETLGFRHIELLDSAEAALRLIADGAHFEIILSDYNMGERMNGQQLLEELTSQNLIGHGSIFIMVTAETSREMVLSALECRPDAYIAKPFNLSTVEKNINYLLEERRTLSRVIEADDNGRREEAISICQQILSDKGNANIKLNRFYAELLNSYEMYNEAIEAYGNCMSSKKPDWVRLGCAKALVGLGRLDEAVSELNRLVDKVTTEMSTYDLLAEVKISQLEPADAQVALEKALALSPNTFSRQKNYAQLCLDNGDTDKAIRASKHTIKLGRFTSNASVDNTVVLAQAQMAHAKRLNEDDAVSILAEAEKNLEVAVQDEHCSDWIRISHYLGSATRYRYKGQGADSKQYCEQAINLIENTSSFSEAELLVILGCVKLLQDLDRPKNAEDLLSRLATEFSDKQEVLQRLDRVSSEPISADGKRKVAEVNKVGVGLYKAGELQRAIRCFEKATQLLPGCVELQLNYVLSCIRLMEKDGVESSLQQQCKERLRLVQSMGVIEKYRGNLEKNLARLARLELESG